MLGVARVRPPVTATAAAVVVLVLVSAVLVWRKKLFRPLGRLHYTAFALAQALFIAWLGYWGFFFV